MNEACEGTRVTGSEAHGSYHGAMEVLYPHLRSTAFWQRECGLHKVLVSAFSFRYRSPKFKSCSFPWVSYKCTYPDTGNNKETAT